MGSGGEGGRERGNRTRHLFVSPHSWQQRCELILMDLLGTRSAQMRELHHLGGGGDKQTFLIACLATNSSCHMVQHAVASAGAVIGGRYCGRGMVQVCMLPPPLLILPPITTATRFHTVLTPQAASTHSLSRTQQLDRSCHRMHFVFSLHHCCKHDRGFTRSKCNCIVDSGTRQCLHNPPWDIEIATGYTIVA